MFLKKRIRYVRYSLRDVYVYQYFMFHVLFATIQVTVTLSSSSLEWTLTAGVPFYSGST